MFLEGKGHVVVQSNAHAVVQGIRLDGDGCVTAHGDFRKQGKGVVVNPKQECSSQQQ